MEFLPILEGCTLGKMYVLCHKMNENLQLAHCPVVGINFTISFKWGMSPFLLFLPEEAANE